MFKQTEQPYLTAQRLSADNAKEYMTAVEVDPLRFFCPNGPQERVIKTVVEASDNTKIPTLVITFGNGVGKTVITCHILANFILGPQNGWFDYPIFRNFPYPKNIWYCSEPDFIKDKFIPEFEKLIKLVEIHGVKYTTAKEGKSYISKFSFSNGWSLSMKSYEQGSEKYEAVDLGIICNDEPASDGIRSAQKERRRLGCITINTMTPLYCEPGVFDEINKADEKVEKGEKRKMYHLTASKYDACRKRGIRGHLDAEIIDDMVSECDPEEIQAKVYGQPMYFAGRIYPELKIDKHRVSPEDYPIPENARIIQVVDPHDARESACVYVAVTILLESNERRFIVFNETPLDKTRQYWEMKRALTVDEEVETWIKIEEQIKQKNITRILDRHFGWQTRGQKTLARLYFEAGQRQNKHFGFIESYKSNSPEGEIQFGHKAFRKQIQDLSDGKPGWVCYDTCFHTWQGITHYIRKHDVTKSAQDKPIGSGKIVERYKDFADVATRYTVCCDIFAHAPVPEESLYDKKIRKWREEDRGKYTTSMDS